MGLIVGITIHVHFYFVASWGILIVSTHLVFKLLRLYSFHNLYIQYIFLSLISLLVFIIDIDNAAETHQEQNGQETQQSQNGIGKFT